MIEQLSNPSSTPLTQPFHDGPPVDPFADLDRLGSEIARLSAHIQAATHRLLVLIREFDERSGWNTGFRSCAHWLNWRTGLDMGAAREKVRVARALAELPKISAAMHGGELSYSKVRALTRVATPETEEELLEFGLAGTAAHVERLVRSWRRVDRIDAMEDGDCQLQQRSLRTFVDEDGMMVVKARLTPEVGAVFRKALQAAGEALYQDSRESEDSSWSDIPAEQRRADALELLAESALEGGLDPGSAGDRYQVVVHVSAETCEHGASDELAGGELEDGIRVSAGTSWRLACDSGRVVMNHGSDGRLLDVGRKTRVIHPALRRALQHRDGSCRFPGCDQQRCDAHHVEHWAEGGETKLDNLVLLCRFHHRLLHEGGVRVELGADGSTRFCTSKGKPIPGSPSAPQLLGDPAAELIRQHLDEGLEIDPFTGFPSWEGGPVDFDEAIQALRSLAEPEGR